MVQEDLRGEPVLLLEEGHCLRDQALAYQAIHYAGPTSQPASQARRIEPIDPTRSS